MNQDSWSRAGIVLAMYFSLVFGAGFLLGPLRVLFLEPRVGQRWAELIEMPVMVAVIVLVVRWIVQGPGSQLSARKILAVGLSAMGIVLIADFGVGVWIRKMSLVEVFTHRDPVSGSAYYLSLAVYGLLPWLMKKAGAAAKGGVGKDC